MTPSAKQPAPPGRALVSEEGVAHTQGPVSGRSELSQFALDVDVDGSKEVDVLAVRRGDVREDFVVDAPPGLAHRIHCQAVILRRPGHHGVGDQRQAPRLLRLLLQVPRPDGAFVGVEQVPFERVQRFALIQLTGDLAPVGRVGEVAGCVDGAAQCPVFLQRRRQRVLPPRR